MHGIQSNRSGVGAVLLALLLAQLAGLLGWTALLRVQETSNPKVRVTPPAAGPNDGLPSVTGSDSEPATQAQDGPSISGDLPGVLGEPYRNDAGGYSVVPPPDWSVSNDGSVTTLSAPDLTAVVTIGWGPSDDAPTGEFLEKVIEATYGGEAGTSRRLEFKGLPALSMSGSVSSADGEDVTLRALVTRSRDPNYAIVYVIRRQQISQLRLRQMHAVTESFTPTT